ncbi:hypothetical protein ACFO3D_08275 [Virgibacillus kekensis]|uniref:Secreted protein n=1 Tax=Virgibacillus kekensis TaxID=202261 RepID=A0ABV9DIG8_9BACI
MKLRQIIAGLAGLIVFIIAASLMMDGSSNNAIGQGAKDVYNYEHLFKGESDNWRAEYHVNAEQVFYEEDDTLKGASESEEVFKLIYKGSLDELAEVNQLEWKYETVAGGGGGTRDFGEHFPDTKVFTQYSGGNGAIEPGDQEIKVSVQWDGNTEEFTLTNTSN